MEGTVNPATGRKRLCDCGTCKRCKHRAYMHEWCRSKSLEERRTWVARRDPETVRRLDRERYRRDKDKRRAALDAYAQTEAGKAAIKRGQQNYMMRYPEKYVAHYTLTNAVRDGRIHRGPCEVCGTTRRVHGHHDDYSKPLDVRWLCVRHHLELHEQLRMVVTP